MEEGGGESISLVERGTRVMVWMVVGCSSREGVGVGLLAFGFDGWCCSLWWRAPGTVVGALFQIGVLIRYLWNFLEIKKNCGIYPSPYKWAKQATHLKISDLIEEGRHSQCKGSEEAKAKE